MTSSHKGSPPRTSRRSALGAPAPSHVREVRELFWQNVVRELLTSLSIAWAEHSERSSPPPDAENLFDGRIGIINALGARIPVGAVYPLFACGIAGSEDDRVLSMEVECTVFQIETPEGEAFTMPLHEIRAVHSLSAELLEQLKGASQERDADNDSEMPFGFAAFTSLARAQRAAEPLTTTLVGPYFPLP